ncbi:multiheme c-type cytochrome [Pseudothauera rhizosphaerae]|uniref:Cytochrome c-552/4 domain-containing protein n=1 Tax=Pseudothauera rhizosphaerae TaxID=2565932 RepID=A0A4V3WBC1_9RHOO|nr:multiheme c-type cytochrome [Pseudothauera rhizosphaerae]THF62677.1 hypothetical protein E6O51_06885 [Pseudothauera rhizosphaerae]
MPHGVSLTGPTAVNHASAPAGLAWRTRETTRQLLHALLVALAITLLTGLALWLGPPHGPLVQVLLSAHLVAGVLALILLAAFATVHLRDGREPPACVALPLLLLKNCRHDRTVRHRLIGHGLLWALALVLLSGLAIAAPAVLYLAGNPATLPYGAHVWLLDVHRWAAPFAVAGLLAHLRRTRGAPQRAAWRPFGLACMGCMALGTALWAALPPDRALGVVVARDMPFYSLPFGDHPFAPGEWKTADGGLVNWRGVPSARSCGECHRREFMEWSASMHAISDRDLIYDASVRENVAASRAGAQHGTEKGRWCESCHNPLGTLTGFVTPLPSVQETEALEEGVGCVVCHTATHPEPLAGNGALTSHINGVRRSVHPAMIMAAPSRHALDMQARRDAPHMGESGLCGACHTEIRMPVVAGQHPLHFQETYDEWRRSPFAAQGVQCQDCHMARDPASYIAALKRGERPRRTVSHRIPGNNYLLSDPDLPGGLTHTLRGGSPGGINRLFQRAEYHDELRETRRQVLGLLEAAAELSIHSASTGGGDLALTVEVRNTGAGHALPTGPLDQRHMWLEVEVLDGAGRTLHHSGAFDGTSGAIDPTAPMWVKHMLDDAGRIDLRHLLFDTDRLVYPRKPIAAGAAERIGYAVALPPDARAPYTVRARLWYRLAFEPILENIGRQGMGEIETVIPPVLMQTAERVLQPAPLARAEAAR